MTTKAVRSLIREVLAEELGRIAREDNTTPSATRKVVSIQTNEDLQALVQHIVKISGDKTMRDRIASGSHVFVLDNNIATPPVAGSGGVVQITEGFLSERLIETLPVGTRVVQLGPGVRFTPLARDRLRQRKIAVERIK